MLKLKELRTERGMSQRAVAAKVQASQKAVALWETGAAEPTAHFIAALADCFGCTADYLLGREDDFGHISVGCDLDEAERTILACFRKLGKENRAHLLDYGEYLLTK